MTYASSLILAAALASSAAEASPDPEPTRADLRIVYTGDTNGIGSGKYDFRLTRELSSSGRLRDARVHHGTLTSESTVASTTPGEYLPVTLYIISEGRRVSDTVALFDDPRALQCDEPVRLPALETHGELFLFDPGQEEERDQMAAEHGRRTGYVSQSCRLERDGFPLVATLLAPSSLPWSPDRLLQSGAFSLDDFEFRLALDAELDDASVSIVGRPLNEASRRFHLLREETSGALYLDVGNFVDGISTVRDDAPSLHRPIGFDMLRRLAPAALVPGENELAVGGKRFMEEAKDLPYVATNWRAPEGTPAPPRHLRRVIELDSGTLDVLFLGAIDPSIASWIPDLAREDITLVDPADSIREHLESLTDAEDSPDLTIVLTSMEPSDIASLQGRLHEADLIIGDTSAWSQRLDQIDLQIHTDRDGGAAATLPVDGVTTASLGLTRRSASWELDTVSVRRIPIHQDSTVDDQVRRAITRTRAAEYPALDRPLIPVPDDGSSVSDDAWAKIACEALRGGTNSDVAFLPRLPPSSRVPGPLSELQVVDRLALRDQVELHYIPGSTLKPLLLQLAGLGTPSCGTNLGSKSPKIWGRGIDSDRLYTLVTTDRARLTTPLGRYIGGAYSSRKLDERMRRLESRDGSPLTLRSAVLSQLRQLRDAGDAGAITALLDNKPTDKPPQLLGRIRSIALSVERFQGANRSEYANVPETLATSPSSFTIGTNLDAALEYSSAELNADLRLRGAFARLTTSGAEPQETADDLRASASASLSGRKVPLGPLRFVPYAELLLDSEFTPAEGEDAAPRQADLSLTVGLSSLPKGILKRIRLGTFALRDLSVLEKSTEVGGRLELEVVKTLGPGLRWSNTLDTYVFANTRQQDDTDLRLKALVESRLSLPVTRWFSASIYGQGFVFQGRLPETRQVAASYSLGAALDIVGAFELAR